MVCLPVRRTGGLQKWLIVSRFAGLTRGVQILAREWALLGGSVPDRCKIPLYSPPQVVASV